MSIKQVQKAKPKRPRIVLEMSIDETDRFGHGSGSVRVMVTQGRAAAADWIRKNGVARFVIEAEEAAKDGGAA